MRQLIHHHRLILLLLALLILLTVAGQGTAAQAAPEPTLHISNVTDTSATISWRTSSPLVGQVRYGSATLDQTTSDERGASIASRIHYVVLSGLSPETTYRFDLLAGGTTDDNGGTHYQLRTGKTLPPGLPETAYGAIKKADGTTAAPDTLLYVRISGSGGQSSELAAWSTAAGEWYVDLGAARVADLSAAFSFGAAEQLLITAWDGLGAQINTTLPITPHFPLPTLRLEGGLVEETLSVSMRPGWQLVNPALASAGSPVESIFGSIANSYDKLIDYDGSTWRGYVPGTGGTLSSVEPTSGLWLHGTAATTLTLRGTYPARQELTLTPGWNLVGFPARGKHTPAALLATLDGKYDQVLGYGATGWLTHLPDGGPGNTLTQLEPGQGYWIHMTAPATLVITN